MAIHAMPLLEDGATEKFSSVRQKLQVALASGIQLASTVTPPLICTSSGSRPSPATWV